MKKNLLVVPILRLLKKSTDEISEYDLIKYLESNGVEFSQENSSDLALFKKHFLVMNALYQLQGELLTDGFYLSISSLSIKIEEILDASESTVLVDDTDIKLSQYYLDWDNYDKTSQSDVEDLLNGFWKQYFAYDQQEQALKVLELSAESNWDEIQQSYRRKVSQCHPDKGGCRTVFIEIREAYEILKCCYR